MCTPEAALLPGRALVALPKLSRCKGHWDCVIRGSPPAGEGLGPGAGNCQEAAPWTCCALRNASGPGASGVLPSSGTGRELPLVHRDPPWPWLPVTLSSPAPLGEPAWDLWDREPEAVLFRPDVLGSREAALLTAREAGSAGAARTLLQGNGPSLRPGFCVQPLGVSSVTSDKLWRGQPYQACLLICTPSLWTCWEDDSTWHTPGA